MFRSKSAIGVDIGSHTVKIVQLRRSGENVEMEKVAIEPVYPNGERSSDPNQQRKAKVEAIRRAISSAKINAKNSVTAVSGESIIVRYLQLPDMPESELKKALQWEAEEYIPFRLDEVNIDSVVLGKNGADSDRVDVLLVSAKKDLVEDHISLVREAGLNPKIVDVDSFAFLNCYEANHDCAKDECVALINIGADTTGISIFQNGVSRFSRDISVGGETITTSIRSHLRCTHEEAELLKTTLGAAAPSDPAAETTEMFSGSLMDTIRGTVEELTGAKAEEEPSKEDIVAKAVGGVLTDLIAEVKRSVEFFENQMRDVSVSRVVLGGGSAVMPNLKEHFERNLSLPVEMIDPMRKVRWSGRTSLPRRADEMRHSLGVGIGLGLRGLAA